MLRAALFFAASAAILPLSWRSLTNVRVHGFYRFFAFEMLLALVLFNAPVWFSHPLAQRQLAAWFLAVVSIGLAIEGFRVLLIVGRPGPGAAQSTNLHFENTTRLVTVGAYRWIRHPLYTSLLALAWDAWLKRPFELASIALTLGATGFLFATAIFEERESLNRFGSEYANYMRTTERFIPFLL